MKTKKIYLTLPILTSLFCFLNLANLQKKELDHQLKFKHLLEQNLVRPLSLWTARFSSCENYNPKKCQELPGSYAVDLGSQVSIQNIFTSRPGSSNKITMTHNLTFADRAWGRDKPIVSFVVPSAQAIWLGLSLQSTTQSGYGLLRDYVFTLPSLSGNEGDETIELQIMFSESWQRFGPLLHPPSLVELKGIQDFTGLYQTYRMESELNRQIDTIVASLFSAVAFVLDHTPEATTLAIYGGLRALRSLLYQSANNSLELGVITEYLALFLNGGALITLCFFLLQICHIKLVNLQKLWVVLGTFSLLFLCTKLINQSFQKIDLITDGLSGLLLFIAGFVFLFKSKPTNKTKTGNQRMWLVLIQGILLITSGYLTFEANLADYVSFTSLGTKSFADPRHLILFPSLVALLFIEMGSVVNTINRVSGIVREKAILDRDLEISSSVQKATMPPKRGQTNDFSWRIVYRPAASIGGDWHDVREIVTKDGDRYLVAIVADVTGHGISAALLTTAIASQWGIWCGELTEHTLSQANERERALGDAVTKIHNGLIALRQHQGVSLSCLLLGKKGEVCFINAGHPGIVMAEKQLTYLNEPSPKPGAHQGTHFWTGNSIVTSQQKVTFATYTDGIFPHTIGISQWLKQMKESFEKDKKEMKSILAEQVLRRWREIRQKKAPDDDITLIIIECRFEQT